MAKKVHLIYDGSGSPVQGALHPSSTIAISYTNVAAKNSDPILTEIVHLHSTTDCYVKFGSSGVVATSSDMFLKADVPEIFSLRGDQYISAIRSSVSGTLHVTLMD